MKKLIKYSLVLFFISFFSPSYSQNQSLSFDGVDDWFVINPYQDLNLSAHDFTIEAMVLVQTKISGFHTILTNNDLNGGGVFIKY